MIFTIRIDDEIGGVPVACSRSFTEHEINFFELGVAEFVAIQINGIKEKLDLKRKEYEQMKKDGR